MSILGSFLVWLGNVLKGYRLAVKISKPVSIYAIHKRGRKTVVYVGKTKNSVSDRINQHVDKALVNKHANKMLGRWLKENCCYLDYTILEITNEADTATRESYWYNYYVNKQGRKSIFNKRDPLMPFNDLPEKK